MNTLQKRLDYLVDKIQGSKQLIELYKESGFNGIDMTGEIKYHKNLIAYYEKRKALVSRAA